MSFIRARSTATGRTFSDHVSQALPWAALRAAATSGGHGVVCRADHSVARWAVPLGHDDLDIRRRHVVGRIRIDHVALEQTRGSGVVKSSAARSDAEPFVNGYLFAGGERSESAKLQSVEITGGPG